MPRSGCSALHGVNPMGWIPSSKKIKIYPNSSIVHRYVWIRFSFCLKSWSFLCYFIKYHKLCCRVLCFVGQSSHFFGLLDNRTIKCRNTDMDQCKLLSHRHLLNIFHFFYWKCTSPVPHPGVFLYHLNSMCAQKNKPKKVLLCLHMKVHPCSYFQYCGYFWGPRVSSQ